LQAALETEREKPSIHHEPERQEFFPRHGWKLLPLLPLAWVIFVVARYAVPVPFMDQWEFVPFLGKYYGGELTLADVWAQHNEHRIFFPRLIMLGLARLTHWNIAWEFAVSIILAIGIFAVVAWQIRRTASELGTDRLKWAIPVASLVIFSVCQFENWLWGWQLQMLLEMLAVWGAVVLLSRPSFRWSAFAAAAALGIVASYSFANGVLVWPLGTALLLAVKAGRKDRAAALASWLLLGALTLWWYFQDYQKPPQHPSLRIFFQHPRDSACYILTYLGNVCAQYGNGGIVPDDVYAIIFGLAGPAILAWAIWTILRHRIADARTLFPYLAMAAYPCGCALLTAVGRSGFGSHQAMISRYCTMTAPLWIALSVLLLLIAERQPATPIASPSTLGPAARQKIARWLFWAVIAFVGMSSAFSVRQAQECWINRVHNRQALLETAKHPEAGGNHDNLWGMFPEPRKVMERYPILIKYHLSVFRDEQAFPSPTEAKEYQ
jgi:hypothetical protein